MYFTDKKFILLIRLALSSIMLFGLFVFLTACEPTEVVDAAASNLDVWLWANDDEYNTIDDKVLVIMRFSQNGKMVLLDSNASVTCNGMLLDNKSLGILGYAKRVPLVPEGGTFKFVYTRNGIETSADLVRPERPQFTSPANGMTVARSNNLTINYVEGSGSSISGRATGQTAHEDRYSVEAGDQPDDGTYSGLNVDVFYNGSGELSLIRKYIDIHSGSTGFNSVESEYLSGSIIDVIWE